MGVRPGPYGWGWGTSRAWAKPSPRRSDVRRLDCNDSSGSSRHWKTRTGSASRKYAGLQDPFSFPFRFQTPLGLGGGLAYACGVPHPQSLSFPQINQV
jgi:hypothetical protein